MATVRLSLQGKTKIYSAEVADVVAAELLRRVFVIDQEAWMVHSVQRVTPEQGDVAHCHKVGDVLNVQLTEVELLSLPPNVLSVVARNMAKANE